MLEHGSLSDFVFVRSIWCPRSGNGRGPSSVKDIASPKDLVGRTVVSPFSKTRWRVEGSSTIDLTMRLVDNGAVVRRRTILKIADWKILGR